ncbi:MAG: hypothetical protein QOH69_792 [Actinomycetota bacterium]|jgi:hypothetical protein|nr:hypothetical protein [Actinomycetota bacterium]
MSTRNPAESDQSIVRIERPVSLVPPLDENAPLRLALPV